MTESGAGGCVDVRFEGQFAIITMRRGQNRMNLTFFEQMHEALDKVERNEEVKVLITTGEDKFYSNGMDLAWLTEIIGTEITEDQIRKELFIFIERILTFPTITIAAINGHAFAGGAVMASAHDFRLMRSDHGWFSVNEIHVGIMLGSFLEEVVRLRLGSSVFAEASLTGRRYTADQAYKRNIIHGIAQKGQNVVEESKEFVNTTLPNPPKNGQFLREMKRRVYRSALDVLHNSDNMKSNL